CVFFFQAEDGIRDDLVTGVQTCALPISIPGDVAECGVWRGRSLVAMGLYLQQQGSRKTIFGFDSFQGFDASVQHDLLLGGTDVRSEEHTSELQSPDLVCRLLLEKKNIYK